MNSDRAKTVPAMLKQWVRWVRVNVAFWLIGDQFGAAVGLLMVTRERALDAISPEGSVNLANCEALAEVLYGKVPGNWNFNITRKDA